MPKVQKGKSQGRGNQSGNEGLRLLQESDESTIDLTAMSESVLAEMANQSAKNAEDSCRSAVQHAINAGRYLTEVKSRLSHGEWLPWLAENFQFSRRTAHKFMELANGNSCSHLESTSSVAEALRIVKEGKRQEAEPEPEPEVEVEPPGWFSVDEEADEDYAADDIAQDGEIVGEVEPAEGKEWFTLDEWSELSEDDRENLLSEGSLDKKFNKQDTASIEWAQWSWNPITGCKHDCPYCYARDIANRFYSQKFEPSIYPARLSAPANTPVPKEAEVDVAYRNVFTGSMADLFGRWVPDEWIYAVLDVVDDNDQWNFLFLTKFPQRLHEFGEVPANAWIGTTVDCQARVDNAEKAFAKIGGGTKWLSVEPMLTPLEFKRLDLFDWIVIGGASASSKTPKWVPPYDWVHDLHSQARKAGCAVYHKDNLGLGDMRLREFPWSERPSRELPDEFKYLGMK